MEREDVPKGATIRRMGALLDLVDDRGEVLMAMVYGPVEPWTERRARARLAAHARAWGYAIRAIEGIVG